MAKKLFHIPYKSKSSSFSEILQIMLMGVCLTFKRNVLIAFDAAAILDDSYQPFDDVKEIEEDIKQLFYLSSMYAFVVYGDLVALSFGE